MRRTLTQAHGVPRLRRMPHLASRAALAAAVLLWVSPGLAEGFRAGFGVASITPDAPDTWTDVDGDGRYTGKDTYEDRNGNGRFDTVWMAGFQNRRAAAGVQDELEAVAAVFEDGGLRVGLVGGWGG